MPEGVTGYLMPIFLDFPDNIPIPLRKLAGCKKSDFTGRSSEQREQPAGHQWHALLHEAAIQGQITHIFQIYSQQKIAFGLHCRENSSPVAFLKRRRLFPLRTICWLPAAPACGLVSNWTLSGMGQMHVRVNALLGRILACLLLSVPICICVSKPHEYPQPTPRGQACYFEAWPFSSVATPVNPACYAWPVGNCVSARAGKAAPGADALPLLVRGWNQGKKSSVSPFGSMASTSLVLK